MSGFVYIWRDRKHNRYYIGAHWGTEDDGYICSSRWMKQAYKRRSEDFKRRILERINTSKKDTFIAEGKWLQLIKSEELRTKYYNIRRDICSYWALNDTFPFKKLKEVANTVENKERVKQHFLDLWADPNYRMMMSSKRKGRKQTKEHVENRAESRRGLMWFTNGLKNIMAKECPSGFYRGQTKFKKEYKQTIEHIKKVADSRRGCTWFTNGIVNKVCKECPEGFWKGQVRNGI